MSASIRDGVLKPVNDGVSGKCVTADPLLCVVRGIVCKANIIFNP